MDWISLGRFHISIGTELVLFIFMALALCLALNQEPFFRGINSY